MKLKKTLAYSELKKERGTIRWPLDKMNLLLDFPHHMAYGIKDEKVIDKLGFDLNKMEKIKCKINQKGICFNIDSSLGKLKICLGTSCPMNIINQALLKEEKKDRDFQVGIKIGNKEFGENHFYPFEITSELELDGILGVEFLKKHIVYIDAHNEHIYIGDKFGNTITKSRLKKIPVEFTVHGQPVVDIEIEKKHCKAIIDLGSSWELILPSSFLREDLKEIYSSTSKNFHGNERNIRCYALSEYYIGKLALKNLYVSFDDLLGVTLDLKCEDLGKVEDKDLGNIGIPILYRTNAFFDFNQRGIWLTDQKNDLKKIGFREEEYEKVPFELDASGLILLKIDSDLGKVRFVLDTGSSISLVASRHVKGKEQTMDSFGNECFSSQKFILGESDYGEKNLYLVDNESSFDFDGILGMDFLMGCPFYIDYMNRFIYFKKRQPNAKINF